MAAKDVKFSADARARMLRGTDMAVEAVVGDLKANARTVTTNE